MIPCKARLGELMEVLRTRSIPYRLAAPLREYTTFRLGGPTPILIDCCHAEDVIAVVGQLAKLGEPYWLIGGGSNLLAADNGVCYPVLRFAGAQPIIQLNGKLLTVAASTILDALVAFAVEHGIAGLVNCSGIPGTVGGAIVGNAGAFGWQIADILDSVQLLTSSGELIMAAPAALGFRYRHSILATTGDIVLQAMFRVEEGDRERLRAERRRILELRRAKHPDLGTHPCAGSFFKNIEPTSDAEKRQAAGWYLEQAGAKCMKVGGAGVFSRHANIIVRETDTCRSRDVLELSARMAAAVYEKFGLTLQREVRFLGDFGE